MQEYLYDDQEETAVDTGISKGFRPSIFEGLKGVKFASDLSAFGSAADLQIDGDVEEAAESGVPSVSKPEPQYELLDEVTTLRNQEVFLSLFPNRFESRIKRGKDGDWKVTSQFHHLSDEEIIEAISGKATFLRAVMADKTTRLFSVTLEKDSFYRTTEGLSKLRDCLQCVGVNQLKLFMSDETEQWQLIAFFKTPVDSDKISNLFKSWLRRNGIVPGTAGVSLFPGAEPFCLPLQPGFAWINDNGHMIVNRNEVSPEAALALFVSDAERTETDGEELIERLEQILKKGDK